MIALKATICLSDIPKAYIRTATNGKKYLDLYIGQRKEVSKYGKTHYIKVDVAQNQEAAFIGDAKLQNARDGSQDDKEIEKIW